MTPIERRLLANQTAICGALALITAELCSSSERIRLLDMLDNAVKASSDLMNESKRNDRPE